MTIIQAEDVEISIRDGSWRLIPTGETISTEPIFQVTRGGGIMEYTPGFGEAHKLPGTVLSLEYARAVVIGYEDKAQRWLLGFHISRTETDQARWLELVRWPPGENELYANAAQQAGRALAEHVGCPLRIFGAKKLPSPSVGGRPGGVTGPLVPHKREDIGPQRVRLFAQSVKLPVQYPGIWLGHARGGVTLKLAKDALASVKGTIAPSFNQCVIDPDQGTIRLMPPTGLLGTFLGGGAHGREIKTGDVRNVELRHTIRREFVPQPDDRNLVTEVTYTLYTWEVYLTLPDESLLLAQTTHSTSSELSRKRATAGSKFSIDSQAGIEYLRQHQEDQEAYEAAETFARTIGIVIASALGVRLVKTQVDDAET